MDARRLHFDSIVVDAHADSVSRMLDGGEDLSVRTSRGHLDIPRMYEGGLDAEVFAAFVDPKWLEQGRAAERALAMLEALGAFCAANADRIRLCRTAAEVREAASGGFLGCILSIEGGHAIQDDLDLLRLYHRMGVRLMTLTWNNSNGWADGCGEEPRHGGLTAFGRDVVREMNRLGMIVDLSHAHETTFWAAIETTRAPVVASHSCARALNDHRRNLRDEQLRAVARNGGVVCVNFYAAFLRAAPEGGPARADLDDVVAHIEHIARVAGPAHVGLGSDFDGADPMPRGLEDCTKLPALTERLLERGFTPEQTRGILGENMLRVMTLAVDRAS